MSTTYYTLAVREDGVWAPQFGDYDRDVVADEKLDYRDHGYSARDLKIIRTGDTQADIDARIAAMNGPFGPVGPHLEDARAMGFQG